RAAAPSAGAAAPEPPAATIPITAITTKAIDPAIRAVRRRRPACSRRCLSAGAAGARSCTIPCVGPDTCVNKARGARRRAGRSRGPAPLAGASAFAALDEIDDRRNPLQAEARTKAILEVIGVVPGDALSRVDLDREPRRPLRGLAHEQQPQAMALRPASR